MLERLVFVSRAVPETGMGEVAAIIRDAHGPNIAAGLTGALVFLDGWYVQALEGPGPELDAALARIARDPRHVALDLRVRERALCRLFAGHALALRTRACLDDALLADFGYRPGFPVADFPAEDVTEFLVSACRRHVLAARPGGGGGRRSGAAASE